MQAHQRAGHFGDTEFFDRTSVLIRISSDRIRLATTKTDAAASAFVATPLRVRTCPKRLAGPWAILAPGASLLMIKFFSTKRRLCASSEELWFAEEL
jgi:hypothetical protein